MIVSVTSSLFFAFEEPELEDEPDLKLRNAISLQDLKDQWNSAARPGQLENRVSRATRPPTSLITGQPATVDTLEGVNLLMRQVTPKWCVPFFFDQEVPFLIFWHTTLQIGNTHEHTVRCQICWLPRASGDIVVVSGPSMVSVAFRLERSWLFCSSDFWLCLFVARFWLVDVG